MRLLGCFLLTFAFTWIAWLASATFAAPGDSGIFGLGGPAFLLGIFAPALVALALTAQSEGRAGVVRLLARIGWWQVGARWYLFAVSYLAATKLKAALIQRLATGVWPTFGNMSLPLILGGMWALWHVPLFFLPGSGSDGQSFPIYTLHVTTLSVVMAWLYWKTEGSLLLVMLMHAAVNNTTGIVPAAVPDATDPLSFAGSLVAWATVGVSSVVAALLLWQMRGASIGAMTSAEPRPSDLNAPEL